ncbi:hypothetical protein KM043_017834 [Ampulex compressa]|nr:hypothetical protein KM043_017834 [Ampulex compressa]
MEGKTVIRVLPEVTAVPTFRKGRQVPNRNNQLNPSQLSRRAGRFAAEGVEGRSSGGGGQNVMSKTNIEPGRARNCGREERPWLPWGFLPAELSSARNPSRKAGSSSNQIQ